MSKDTLQETAKGQAGDVDRLSQHLSRDVGKRKHSLHLTRLVEVKVDVATEC
jgi:hypothetical protein